MPEAKEMPQDEAAARKWLADRTRAALQERKAAGRRTGTVPWGWMLDPKDRTGKCLIPSPREQEIADRARAMAAEGWSQHAIAEELTDLGYLSREGTPLTQAAVWRILRGAPYVRKPKPAGEDPFYADRATGRALVKVRRGPREVSPPAVSGTLKAQALARKWAAKGYSPRQIAEALAARGSKVDAKTIRRWLTSSTLPPARGKLVGEVP